MAFTSVARKVVTKFTGEETRGFPWSAPNWPQSVPRPAPRRRVGVDYPTDWARRYPARLARALVLDNVTRPLTHIVASPDVRGIEMLELVEPPVVFVANHASHVDTPLLLSVLPARFRHKTVVAGAADHFFDRQWKAHLWALTLAVFPIERNRVNRRSIELATALLEDGWNVLIYPEGGRSHDGWFGEFHNAALYPAARAGRTVVPVHIEGTFGILPRDGKRLMRSPTTVTFGSPVPTMPDEDARRLGARVEKALAVLADEVSSDYWTARRRAGADLTPSPRGPHAAPWRRSWALGEAQREDESDEGRWAVSGRDPRPWRIGGSRVGRAG
jgi:1-acyl-sn-glycerol-3-phosphate acyltransferase